MARGSVFSEEVASGMRQSHAGPRPTLALGFGLLALALRAVHLLESAGDPFRHHLILDSAFYDQWARAIVAGRPFGDGPFLQAPLYPYFLAGVYALFGAHPGAALWIQALLGAATVTCAALVAQRAWGRAGAFAAGLLLALYLPGIFYTGVLLVPVLATFLLALALLFTPRWPLLAGLCTGAAGLAHPLLLPGGLVALLGGLRLRRPAVLAILGVALGLAPATIHNLAAGRFVPIATNSGLNLYIGNGPAATGFFTPPPGLGGDEDLHGVREAIRLAGRPLDAVAASDFWTARAEDEMRARPGRTVLLYLRKLYFFVNAYEAPQVESFDFEKRYSVLLRVPLLPGWAALTALAAAAVVLRRRDRLILRTLAAAGAIALATALFFVTARFRYPAHLYLALAAAGGLAELARTRARWAGALAAAAATALLVVPNWARIDNARTFGNAHLQLGMIAEKDGRATDAQREYADALRADPRLARAAINLGILTARGGDLARARPLLEQGVTLDPRSARGLLALGQIRELGGEAAEACSLYARAWEADTSFVRSLESLAAARYLSGDVARAETAARDFTRRVGPRDPLRARADFLLARVAERRREGWPLWTSPARAEADLAFGVGDLARAETLYRQAIAVDARDLGALLELFRIAEAREDVAARTVWGERFVAAGGPSRILEPRP
jgi:tetratricopeptide (TPR) repeat protein